MNSPLRWEPPLRFQQNLENLDSISLIIDIINYHLSIIIIIIIIYYYYYLLLLIIYK